MGIESMEIRLAGPRDIPGLVRLRRLMFEHMGGYESSALERSDAACRAYFARTLRTGKFRCWIAVTSDGRIVASGGVVVDRHPPGPGNMDGRVAYVMSMSTDPAYRRRGLARLIFTEIMSWVRAQGISLAALHTTADGRMLYESFGFAPSQEMLCETGTWPADAACCSAGPC